MPVASLVGAAVVKAARMIMKIKGIEGAVGTSPEGIKKAYRIISQTGKTTTIQNLIAHSPSQVTLENLKRILGQGKTLSQKVFEK